MKCERLQLAVCVLGIVVRVTKVQGGLVYLNIQEAEAADHYLIISPYQRREVTGEQCQQVQTLTCK
jgi:hypothetical protein